VQDQRPQPTAQPMYDQQGNQIGVEIAQELSYDTNFRISKVHNRTATVPPPGLYIIAVNGVYKEAENRFNPDVERLRFDFLVEHVIDSEDPRRSAEFVGQVVHGWANNTMGPKATLRAWAEALLQRLMDDDDELQVADLIGKQAKATYINYTKENGSPGVKLSNLAPYRPEQQAPRGQPVSPQQRPQQQPQRQAQPPRQDQRTNHTTLTSAIVPRSPRYGCAPGCWSSSRLCHPDRQPQTRTTPPSSPLCGWSRWASPSSRLRLAPKSHRPGSDGASTGTGCPTPANCTTGSSSKATPAWLSSPAPPRRG
jgi:hypothetical protein